MARCIVSMLVMGGVVVAADVVTFDDNWSATPLFTVVSETPTSVEVIFSMHSMVVENFELNGEAMQTYGVPAVSIAPEGAPNLTGANRYIAVPQGARAQVTILDARTEVLQNVTIAPAPNIPRENDDTPLRYEKDMRIYGRNAFYPESPVRLSKPKTMRGVDVVLLGVLPFQYNPVTRELLVYKDVRIRVDFVGGNGHFGENRLRSRFWEPMLQSHLLNYGSLPRIDFYAPERLGSRAGVEYIIIVPNDAVFEAWGDTIKHWRQLQGISCDVYTLTEVGGSTKEAIKSFLQNAYTTWDPAPVAFLLLSDYPSSGRAYGITSNVITHPDGFPAYASDNWYADFDNDTLPELHHARICAQDGADLSTMINKFLSYERNPYVSVDFYDHPLVAGGWQTERWFQLALEVCKGFFVNSLGKNPETQYQVYAGNPYAGCPWTSRTGSGPVINYWVALGYIPATNPYGNSYWNNGSAAGINAAINAGAFIVQHRDHGEETGWSEPAYQNPDLDGLTNTMLTFVNSTNCLTGRYHWSSECFTEKFHRITHGALGVNGASSVSYSFVNDTYIWGMFDALWPQFDPGYPTFDMTGYDNLRPCQSMTSGKYYLEASWFPDSVGLGYLRNITYGLFHHHGDCFNVLYSEVPQNLTVHHDDVCVEGASSFSVSANDSSVIALTVAGEIIGVAEGTGSYVDVPIIPQAAGAMITITVTKANYYRYEQSVPVAAGPYVVVSSLIVNDAGGNGQVNPGEEVDLGVWAKDIGTEDVYDVYGLLQTADPYVTVNTDSSWYGTMVAGDSSISNPYYHFIVAPNCPNEHDVQFALAFHDNSGNSWTSYPEITVYAPLLELEYMTVVNDDNDNGILEPGESADLVATLMNSGGAAAESVTSLLATSSSYITITDDAGSFGTIDTSTSASNAADPYSVSASSSTPYGTSADFSMIVQSGIYCDTFDVSIMIGTSVPSDTGYYYVYYSGGPHVHSPVFSWIGIDTSQSTYAGTSLNLNDDQTVVTALPFTFRYYGINYTQISICSNGWIAMGSQSATSRNNAHIPDTIGPTAMIAGMWDDLDPGNTGAPSDVYYYYDAAEHRFIVEYFRVEHYPSGNQETFEIIFYDPAYYATPTGDGEIIVQYLSAMHETDNTLGIENLSENVGIEYYFDGTYDSLAVLVGDSFALKYTTYPPDYVGIEEDNEFSSRPQRTVLSALYPNPFSKQVVVFYQVRERSRVQLDIYDATGRLVRNLEHGVRSPGYYTVLWNGCDNSNRAVSTGIYFTQFTAQPEGQSTVYTGVEKAILVR